VADANLPLAKARYAYFLFCHNGSRFEAQRLLATALGHPGKNAEVLFLAGLIHWCYRNDREGAREYFLEASAVDPSNPGALIWAAQTSLVRGDGKTAAHLYRRLSKRVPLSPEMAGNLGLALLLEHKPDGALRHLSRAAKSAADNFAIRTNLAAALYALRRSSEAVELMRELLRQHPLPRSSWSCLPCCISLRESRSKFPARLQALVDSGTRADGWAIRAMVYGADSHIRSVGMAVADAVEAHRQTNLPDLVQDFGRLAAPEGRLPGAEEMPRSPDQSHRSAWLAGTPSSMCIEACPHCNRSRSTLVRVADFPGQRSRRPIRLPKCRPSPLTRPPGILTCRTRTCHSPAYPVSQN